MLATYAPRSLLPILQPSLDKGGVQGTLIHKDSRQPGIDIQIELYSKNIFKAEHLLGRTRSDSSGHFTIGYTFHKNLLTRYLERDQLILKVVGNPVIEKTDLLFHRAVVLQTIET